MLAHLACIDCNRGVRALVTYVTWPALHHCKLALWYDAVRTIWYPSMCDTSCKVYKCTKGDWDVLGNLHERVRKFARHKSQQQQPENVAKANNCFGVCCLLAEGSLFQAGQQVNHSSKAVSNVHPMWHPWRDLQCKQSCRHCCHRCFANLNIEHR